MLRSARLFLLTNEQLEWATSSDPQLFLNLGFVSRSMLILALLLPPLLNNSVEWAIWLVFPDLINCNLSLLWLSNFCLLASKHDLLLWVLVIFPTIHILSL